MNPFPESHRSIPVASRTARLTFLGDALCQMPLLAAHETPGGHDFRPVFAPLRNFLADSDFVVANLETPLSEDDGDLTHERWRFNSPRAYAEALQWAGVDFVTTANNHCLDRGTAGLAATIRVLDSICLPHTGIFADREAAARPAIADVAGFRLGLLSYTYGTNAFSNHEYLHPDESFMVNLFQEQELSEPLARAWFANRDSPEGRAYEEMERKRWPENLSLPVYERMEQFEARRARFAEDVSHVCASRPDFIALGMHAGGQYDPAATARTRELASFAQSCGVDFVFGHHEHVIHGGDFPHIGDDKLATYCLGDLASCTGLWTDVPNRDTPRIVRFSIAWHIDIARIPDGGASGGRALPASAGGAHVAGSSFSVLVRRRGDAPGRVVVHPAAELWRSLPPGPEKDALAADIRAAAETFAGRSLTDEPIADEYPL